MVSSCIQVSLQYLLYPTAWGCSKFSFIILKPTPFLKNSVISYHCFRIEIKISNHTYKSQCNWHHLSLGLHHRLLSPPFWHFSHIRPSHQGLNTCDSSICKIISFLSSSLPTYSAFFFLLLIFQISTHPSLSQALIPDWISFLCPITVLRNCPIVQASSPFAWLTFWTR